MADVANYQDPNTPGGYSAPADAAPELQQAGAQLEPPMPQAAPNSPPPDAPAPPDASAAPQPFWKRILQGALSGMAGGAGAHNWGQALGGGAGAVLKQNQQDIENKQQSDQLNRQIAFDHAQSAHNAAMMTQEQQRIDMLKGAARITAQRATDDHSKFLQSLGATVTPIAMGQAGGGPTSDYLQQATANGQAAGQEGAHVNGWSVNGPDTSYAVSFDGTTGPVARYNTYASAGKAMNLPVASKEVFVGAKPVQQSQMEVVPQQYIRGNVDANGKPYTKANEMQLRSDMKQAQEKVASLTDADGEPTDQQAFGWWSQRLNGLKRSSDVSDALYNRDQSGRMAVAASRQMDRVVNVVDPSSGSLTSMTNRQRLANGLPEANASAINSGSKGAQLNDIQQGVDNMQQAITGLPTEKLSPLTITAFTNAMKHGDPSVRASLIGTLAGSDQLSPAEQDWVVAASGLAERAMSMRNIGSQGTGSDQQRTMLVNTLPGITSGTKAMMNKQLAQFNQMLQTSAGGIPKVPGLGQPRLTPPMANTPAQKPIYAAAPGKPRLMSTDGGKTWQPAPQQ